MEATSSHAQPRGLVIVENLLSLWGEATPTDVARESCDILLLF
jgi:hypothetical protein